MYIQYVCVCLLIYSHIIYYSIFDSIVLFIISSSIIYNDLFKYFLRYLEIHPDWRPPPQQPQIQTLSLFYPSEPSWLFSGRIRSRSWRCKQLLPPPCCDQSRMELQRSGRSSYNNTQPHKWHVMSKLWKSIFIEVFHSFSKEWGTCHIKAFSRVSVDKLKRNFARAHGES